MLSTALDTTSQRSTVCRFQLQPACDDARDVKKILYQARLGARVAVDARERPLETFALGLRRPEDLQPAEDGVQQRAKFM